MAESTFWTAQRRKFWLIGGVLILLTAGGVLTAYLVASKPEGLPRSAAKGELSAFLSDEHRAAFREGTKLEQKFPVTDPDRLGDSLRDWLGSRVSFQELFPGGGVKLLGAGESAVPGAGTSAHLRLGAEPHQLSLFIKQYRKLPPLDDQTAYTLPGRGLGENAPPITVWRRGGQVLYLVANSGEGLKVLAQGLGAPEPKKPY
jgi:hypothetical protein